MKPRYVLTAVLAAVLLAGCATGPMGQPVIDWERVTDATIEIAMEYREHRDERETIERIRDEANDERRRDAMVLGVAVLAGAREYSDTEDIDAGIAEANRIVSVYEPELTVGALATRVMDSGDLPELPSTSDWLLDRVLEEVATHDP